jgi:hypothetical protein
MFWRDLDLRGHIVFHPRQNLCGAVFESFASKRKNVAHPCICVHDVCVITIQRTIVVVSVVHSGTTIQMVIDCVESLQQAFRRYLSSRALRESGGLLSSPQAGRVSRAFADQASGAVQKESAISFPCLDLIVEPFFLKK